MIVACFASLDLSYGVSDGQDGGGGSNYRTVEVYI